MQLPHGRSVWKTSIEKTQTIHSTWMNCLVFWMIQGYYYICSSQMRVIECSFFFLFFLFFFNNFGLCIIMYIFISIYLNPHWHELWKQEKCSSLAPPRGTFLKNKWAWLGAKSTQLMSIFTPKKVLKVLIKIQLTKSDPKMTRR